MNSLAEENFDSWLNDSWGLSVIIILAPSTHIYSAIKVQAYPCNSRVYPFGNLFPQHSTSCKAGPGARGSVDAVNRRVGFRKSLRGLLQTQPRQPGSTFSRGGGQCLGRCYSIKSSEVNWGASYPFPCTLRFRPILPWIVQPFQSRWR